jgi:polyphosphate kinase
MAPIQMKPKVLDLIGKETAKGGEGKIIAKMNSIVDEDVITALYKASQAGVAIYLIIRGICCLRPGIPGISENIRVVSIVGKYLEHTRSFYFKHSEPQVYFSSADWMPRNLVKRIELLTPVYDKQIATSIHEMMVMQLNDNVQARDLQTDGTYHKVTNDLPTSDSQAMMEKSITKSNQENVRRQQKSPHKIQIRSNKEVR